MSFDFSVIQVEFLCERGADVNRGQRSSSLHYAACFGRPAVAKVIMFSGPLYVHGTIYPFSLIFIHFLLSAQSIYIVNCKATQNNYNNCQISKQK